MLGVPVHLVLGQTPDVWDEEIFRFVFLHIFELEVRQLGEPVLGELRGSLPDHLLDLLHRETPAPPLRDLLQPGADVDQDYRDVPHQVLHPSETLHVTCFTPGEVNICNCNISVCSFN